MAPSIMSGQSQLYLRKTVDMGAKIGCIPFKLNSDLKLVERRGKLVTLTSKINNFNAFVMPVYLLGRCAHWMVFRDHSIPEEMKNGMTIIFILITYLHSAATMLDMATNHEAHCGFVQTMVTFFRTAKGHGKRKRANGCERYLYVFWFEMRLLLVGMGAVLLFKPERVHTLMSIFSEPYKQPFFFPVTLANFSCATLSVVISHYGVVIPIVYIFTMYTKIHMLKSAVASRWMISVKFAHIYRSTQLLQRNFNSLFGTWLLPIHQNLHIVGSVMGIYGCGRMSGPVRIIWGVLMLINIFHLSFAYHKMGQLYEESRKLLEVADNISRKHGKWPRRFLASCKPIAVTHGSMFFVDRGLVLTIWSTIACNAVSLLVMEH